MSSTLELAPVGLNLRDEAALAEAVRALEHESFATRLTHRLGHGAARLLAVAPPGARQLAEAAATAALERALRLALASLSNGEAPARTGTHKTLVTLSGAAGGAFGLAALPLELPTSTVLILRSIADIARSEGEDLRSPAAALACMEVFALGGRTSTDDQMDSAYFALRAALASTVTEAARHVARHGIAGQSAPALVRFVSAVASRFGLVVSQKVAAQSVPVLGALGGAAINYAFAQHFTTLARGHFTIRCLERAYGAAPVRDAYARIAATQGAPRND